mmetsp:Transcript_12413/g.35273  ORF Transcript_12413/g.35273 Transcript_12413/m.35273 type:complete len:230 (+) Transcript_12413:1802-2491(+)
MKQDGHCVHNWVEGSRRTPVHSVLLHPVTEPAVGKYHGRVGDDKGGDAGSRQQGPHGAHEGHVDAHLHLALLPVLGLGGRGRLHGRLLPGPELRVGLRRGAQAENHLLGAHGLGPPLPLPRVELVHHAVAPRHLQPKLGNNIRRATLRFHPATLKPEGLVKAVDEMDLVQGHHDRAPLPRRALHIARDCIKHGRTHHVVQGRERVVQHQQVRLRVDGPRNGQAHLLPAT